MDYQHFDAAAFAADEYFQQWVLLPGEANDHFWQDWVTANPEKSAAIEEARQTVLSLGYREHPLYTAEIRKIKAHVMGNLDKEVTPASPTVRSLYPTGYRIAASLTGLLLLSLIAWMLLKDQSYATRATGYGEIKEFYLPDSSLVVLNANSTLKYLKKWEETGTRKVWLEGEAFFHVRKQRHENDESADAPGFAKFIVYAEALTVEVLGTEFNVNHREDQTEVTLKSGKVKLAVQNGQSKQEIEMQPGELVKFARQSQLMEKTSVDPATRTAWKEGLLVFDHLTLREIAGRLEDTYGVQVVFENAGLADKRFKGFVPAGNLDMLLKAFSKLYNIKISQKGKTLIFQQVEEVSG